MKLPIIYYGNPILRKKCEPIVEITDEIRQFAADLEETMIAHHGLGLSAPQVGRSIAMFIASPPIGYEKDRLLQAEPTLFINPKLIQPSDDYWVHSEACLSIPKLYGDVPRPIEITITYQDIEGKEHVQVFKEWPARVLMHENDHLNGVLFIDRLDDRSRKALEPRLRELKKQYSKYTKRD